METATLTSTIPAEEIALLEAMMEKAKKASQVAKAKAERSNRSLSYFQKAEAELARNPRATKSQMNDLIRERLAYPTGRNPFA